MKSALDLFAGAGGFSLGLKEAGIHVAGAIEVDRFACETYRANFSRTPVHQRSLESCSNEWLKGNFSGVDIVAGGPPCQGFSVAGPTQYGLLDPRNSLILDMARAISVLRPQFAVLENVKGILSGKVSSARRALDAYMSALAESGYSSQIIRLQAADFGVPQLRERVFVISHRGSEDFRPGERIAASGNGMRVQSRDCFTDLPDVLPSGEEGRALPYLAEPKNDFQKRIRRESIGVQNHVGMKHTRRILERLNSLLPGQSMKDADPRHGQRRRNTSEIDAGQRYKMNCTRINPDLPSLSLPANFQTIHVHPWEDRMLTAREGARIQGFPDRFSFCGPRTLMSKKLLEREGRHEEIGLSQYNQIGNAVPPPLATAIGRVLIDG